MSKPVDIQSFYNWLYHEPFLFKAEYNFNKTNKPQQEQEVS